MDFWPTSWIEKGLTKNIVLLEIFLISVALELWGVQLRDSRILFHPDNKGVAFSINFISFKSVLAVLSSIETFNFQMPCL